jgi:hypothetical protein
MPINIIQIFSLFLLALLGASMASNEWAAELDDWDSRQIRSYFGNPVAREIDIAVLEIFEEKTSATHATGNRFVPSDWLPLAKAREEIPPEMAAVMTWGMERWLLLSDMVHRILRRVVALMEFDTLGFLIFCTFLIDGITEWRVRRVSFAYSSPLAHRTTLWLLVGLVALLAIAVIAPIPFLPALIPLHILVLSWTLRTHVAHLPKRL